MNKRGVSAVIAAVMLIMITVVAAGLIFSFVIPFVNEQTEGASECFDVFGGLEFGSTAFNCYVESADTGCGADTNGDGQGDSPCYDSTGFSVRVTKDGIAGVRVSLVSEGSSDIFDIKDAENLTDLRMLEGATFGSALEFPQSGGMRTYVAKGIYENAQVGAILDNGNFCDFSDSVIFNECLGEAAEKVGGVNPSTP